MLPAKLKIEPPYYAVIFANQRRGGDDGYGEMAEAMVNLAQSQPGYLGLDSARGEDGFGITVSYWESLKDIENWKANARHQVAQRLGKTRWYGAFSVHIAKVERSYASEQDGE